ncbi:MAG: leucine-rich repeat domain-containing protein [Roseburia sp.]|nr:leucine-rich repeat domain-containing protein [Roseburia sp.]
MERYQILWRKNSGGKAEVLRVYAESAKVTIPEALEGCRVSAIAPYCFSSASHIPEGDHFLTVGEGSSGEAEGKQMRVSTVDMRELAGNLVEEVTLPSTVRKLGASAFYNCKKLKRMVTGASLADVGSDAFMNTIDFHEMTLLCSAGEKTGLKQILAQISSDMEVTFQGREGIEAVLLYPEYDESYDEIAPAHLFGRNITGEGFRARQGFKEGVVDFGAYDKVFPQACVEESEKILSKMALNRLMYPFGLTEKNSRMYREYLESHVENLAGDAVRARKLEILRFLCEDGLLTGSKLKRTINFATETEWVEGAAELMHIHAGQEAKRGSGGYEFEDF